MKTTGVSYETKFGLLFFLGHPTVAVLSLSFNVHSLHPIDQFDLLAVVELQTSAFSFPSRGAGG